MGKTTSYESALVKNSPIFELNFLIAPTTYPFCLMSKLIFDNFCIAGPQQSPS